MQLFFILNMFVETFFFDYFHKILSSAATILFSRKTFLIIIQKYILF